MNIRLFIAGLIGVGSCFFMIAAVSADNVKIENNPENCKKINNYGGRDKLNISLQLKVPVSSVRFLGTSWKFYVNKKYGTSGKDGKDCVINFDSAKGPVECLVERDYLYTDDGGVTAWIPLTDDRHDVVDCNKSW